MAFLDELFKNRDLFMLTGADGHQVHLGFSDGRKAVYFFTSQDAARTYIAEHRLKAGLARINWKTFNQVRADLLAAHVRLAAIDPHTGVEATGMVIPLEHVRSDNPVIWGQPAR
ncbi:MAG: hypothetical protein FJZ00_09065 [Candidatus Sericytochromatia bacterium]|uniref:Uncharacterized protein n=1 Tax=Candidatus Tanganyikabacteria bacterium TaxID=2961651 RepID=A0A937X6L3_9BACT|nr:hypothetical protein [Candidatus Tanganyikabacteria bacterium]